MYHSALALSFTALDLRRVAVNPKKVLPWQKPYCHTTPIG